LSASEGRLDALKRGPRGPRIYAHRGLSARHPENTMAAFGAAITAGADGIELDVRATGDGSVIVFHDRTLERLAGRPEVVAATPLSVLRRVELPGGGRIPLLDEVLDLLAPTALLLNVEIKGDGGRRFRLANLVSALLRRRARRELDRIFVSSFRPEVLAWLRALGGGVPTAFLYDAENTGLRRAHVLQSIGRFDLLHPHASLVDADRLAAWHAAGRLVNVWTVDEPRELRRLGALGVDGIITNDPEGARAALSAPG
jgi:glycerophosphoryl diester phosphodiesterase